MNTTVDTLTQRGRQLSDAWLALASSGFSATERLIALQMNTLREAIEQSLAHAKRIAETKDAQEFFKLQQEALTPSIEKTLAYQRNVYEVLQQSQTEIAKIVETQLAEANRQMIELLDKMAKSAPTGTETVIAAAKSAIAAANSAYDNLTKAAKQVAEIAEANMTAATSATVKAVTSASQQLTPKSAPAASAAKKTTAQSAA